MTTHHAAPDARVLLVEDDLPLRDELRDLLEGEGFEVVEAGDGWEALGYLRTVQEFSVVLLDIGLPVMSGWELLARMRGDLLLRDLPVIIMSAKPVADAVGTPPVFKKPLGDPEPLLAAIREHGRHQNRTSGAGRPVTAR